MSNGEFDERWLAPNGIVPVDMPTTGALVREIQRLRKLCGEALQGVPPLDVTKIPEGFRGVVWFRADGIYKMGECGWERYSPTDTNSEGKP